MGLAGRKTKQRIGADPRNLSWADDASKFGSAYLAKFGWDSSKGLGVAADGRTTHVKVQHKLDMLGIGAAHMHDPNGIAWKQNRDFENLLKRLNEQTNGEGNGRAEEEETKVEGFISAVAVSEGGVESGKKDKKEKDKKKKKDNDDQEGKKSKRKRKDRDDTEHKTRKRKKGADEGEEDSFKKPKTMVEESNVSIPRTSEAQQVVQPVIPRHRAHRARAIAAKKMLSSSATAISEILGIAPTHSSSLTPSGSTTPQGQLTTVDDDVVGEQITTSTKSVADYFKEKLLSKSSGQSGSMTPNTPDDAYDTPRGGLGSSRFKMDSGETTSSGGMSKFASLMSSTFLAAASSAASAPSIPKDVPDNREGREKAVIDGGDRSQKHKKGKKNQDKEKTDHHSEQPEEQARKEKKRRKKEQ